MLKAPLLSNLLLRFVTLQLFNLMIHTHKRQGPRTRKKKKPSQGKNQPIG
jgi:hypothetical protein